MSDELLIRFASPTLASLKVGSLISYRTSQHHALLQVIESWNAKLNRRGVVVRLLQHKDDLHLIYVHRPNLLLKRFNQLDVRNVLEPLGYPVESVSDAMDYLVDRLANADEFPHEIGLFLGYPTADVLGFIQHKGCNGKCDGCWKVYTDVDGAQRKFALYKKCTRLYLEALEQGRTLEDLTVWRKEA